uniref:Uncharacterized protein n=1 Tax=Anguilla anguilla TaxID=7936 RepID=A0A0E9SW29_ANGAN
MDSITKITIMEILVEVLLKTTITKCLSVEHNKVFCKRINVLAEALNLPLFIFTIRNRCIVPLLWGCLKNILESSAAWSTPVI